MLLILQFIQYYLVFWGGGGGGGAFYLPLFLENTYTGLDWTGLYCTLGAERVSYKVHAHVNQMFQILDSYNIVCVSVCVFFSCSCSRSCSQEESCRMEEVMGDTEVFVKMTLDPLPLTPSYMSLTQVLYCTLQ